MCADSDVYCSSRFSFEARTDRHKVRDATGHSTHALANAGVEFDKHDKKTNMRTLQSCQPCYLHHRRKYEL